MAKNLYTDMWQVPFERIQSDVGQAKNRLDYCLKSLGPHFPKAAGSLKKIIDRLERWQKAEFSKPEPKQKKAKHP